MEPREKFLSLIPHLRYAFEEARREGVAELGVVASHPDGGGRIIARFNGDEFLADLCAILGVPLENTEEEQLDAAASSIVSMFGPVVADPPEPEGQ